MNQKTMGKANTKAYLISGLVVLVFGVLVFIPSVLSYKYFLDENKAMKEKEASQGIGDIPGVSLADTITFFLALTILGGLLSVAGAGLILAAILSNRGTRDTGPDAGKSFREDGAIAVRGNAMNCPNCGARILDGGSFCERCGLQVGTPQFKSSQLQPQPTKDNKVLWLVAIVVIVVVVVPVVLAVVLYVMVLGFGGTSTQTPTSSLTKSTVTGGDKLTFAPMSMDTPWGDVSILLTDWNTTVLWSPLTTDLDDATTAEWVGGSQMLGTLKVFANITDLAGNGYVNQGDYVTLTVGGGAFSATTTYTVTIMHDPSSAEICHITFQG